MAPNGEKNQSDALSNQEQDCAKGRTGFSLFIYLLVYLFICCFVCRGFECGRVGKLTTNSRLCWETRQADIVIVRLDNIAVTVRCFPSAAESCFMVFFFILRYSSDLFGFASVEKF